MENIIYPLAISVFIPIFLMALLVDKRARLPIVFVLAGIFASVFSSEINGCLMRLLSFDNYEMTTIVTPITEEVIKSLPILYYAIVFSDKREKLLTASMATGIGFVILENAYYMLQNDSFNIIDAVIRAFGSGLMHGMCTLLVGVGISFVKKKRKIFGVGTFALLSTAVTYHGIYNMLIQSNLRIVGTLLPIATYIPFFLWRIRLKKREQK